MNIYRIHICMYLQVDDTFPAAGIGKAPQRRKGNGFTAEEYQVQVLHAYKKSNRTSFPQSLSLFHGQLR